MTDQPFATVIAMLMAALAAVMTLGAPVQARAQAADFDFYVLSLSWSPTFCASPKGDRNPAQCGREREYGFIVHGLWPQYERGYPEYCRSREPARVPRSTGDIVFDIMPSMGLIGHQWRKHGSCTGLTQRAYFEATRRAFERVRIPADLAGGDERLTLPAAEIERKFVEANPGMSPRGIAASCEGRRLEDIRICMTKDFRFRDCAEVDRGGCRLSQVELPPSE